MSGRAFSLFEVMLAIALVVVLSASVHALLFDMMRKRDRMLELTDAAQVGIGVFETVERDLATCLAGTSRAGSGVTGNSISVTLLTRSVTLAIDDESPNVLGDLQRVRIAWNAQGKRLEAERADVSGTGPSRMQVLSEQVEYVQFRYFDGRDWRGSFDSSSSASESGGASLPVAIELAIWFSADRVVPIEADQAIDGLIAEQRGEAEDWLEEDFVEPEPIVVPTRAPDRVRVMIVPDGPSAGWGDGA